MNHPYRVVYAFVLAMCTVAVYFWFSTHRTCLDRGSEGAIGIHQGSARRLPVARQNLSMPIQGIAGSDLRDTFNETRPGGKRHGATDILAARGTPIHAMADGSIRKLFLSKAGGNTIYEFDETQTYCFYYAHLERYAPGLTEGMQIRRGDVIGYVGTTGDAPPGTPHLHLEIISSTQRNIGGWARPSIHTQS